jgi:aarF domain-containing kinase
VIAEELGPEWRSLFSDFEPIPFASASIGQVHLASSAVIPSKRIALKIQFPSVAESITSDLRNISLLLHTSRLLPRGLYLGNTLTALEEELKEECDYVREAENARRFRRLLDGDERFEVPRVIEEVSRKRVLGLEWMDGVPVGKGIGSWDQNTRNEVILSIFFSTQLPC